MQVKFVGKSFEIMARALEQIGAKTPVRHTADHAVKMLTRAADKARIKRGQVGGSTIREANLRHGVGRPPAINLERTRHADVNPAQA